MKKLLLTSFLLLLCPVLSPGWGFFAHRTITQLAVYSLPAPMRGFYYRHMPELVHLSTAADERRDAEPTEASKHFIYMDHYGDDPFGLMPKSWDKATAKYTADTLQKYGTMPWAILGVKEKLTEAFRQRDTAAIVRLSADLSHYVGDAYAPLHTTINYDGQLTKQEGIQTLWEHKLPERHIAEYKLDNEPAKYVKDPLSAIWQVVQESYGFLGATFDFEEQVTRKFTPETKYVFSHKYGKTRRAYSDAFADAYHEKQVGGMIAFRLRLAPTLVGSLWLTAWKDAGSPDLNGLLAKKPTKEENEKLDEELKAWKDNQLVSQQILAALKKEKARERPDLINAAKDMPPPPTEEAAAPAATPAAAPAAGAPPVPGAPTPPAGTEKVKVKAKPADGPAQKAKTKAADKPAKKKKPAADGWDTPAGSGW
ncbi:zinc dependent phospholipase C family protein [Hymenobacter weizhouensis]|uniref:zinc dependent phospholipase C family protein n=1 Tax=Hymenobacter sp. YIM 151500-1 TaxID=2987689 RepID=UPI00222710B3|nr:zinc dependent phospholipase C family protein [Hymenobacter sp. YIM 151500-1]UYZ65082.1 zinc dependent phospholipase C family protein [Hymenobacter sp. YIM 151500-1]